MSALTHPLGLGKARGKHKTDDDQILPKNPPKPTYGKQNWKVLEVRHR